MEREDWNRRYRTADSSSTEPNRFLVAEIGPMKPARALDLGSGAGRNAVWLAERGWEVTAVDFSEVGMAGARHLASRRAVRINFVPADLRDYLPPADAFDLVLLLYVHLPHDERRLVLRRATAALAPGGTLLVVGHDLSNLAAGHGGPRNPDVLYAPEALVTELPGLVIEHAGRFTRSIKLEESEVEAIDALVRARKRTRALPGGGKCSGRRAR